MVILYIMVILWLYCGYIGIMENKMETNAACRKAKRKARFASHELLCFAKRRKDFC